MRVNEFLLNNRLEPQKLHAVAHLCVCARVCVYVYTYFLLAM